MKENTVYVDSDAKLEAAITEFKSSDILAIDTEFVRRTTYYPVLALLQIASRDRIFLIDPTAVQTLEPLKEVLQSSAVKIAHSAGEDLEVLRQAVGVVPDPLFDTQIAASFLGYGAAPGYANLLNNLYDLSLDKSQTTSNWLARPLTASQLSYAEEDVLWLPKIYDQFIDELTQLGRMDWCLAECAAYVEKGRYDTALEDAPNRFKVRGRWDGIQMARLRDLATWREETARSENQPRSWILKDATVLQLAERPTDSVSGLSRFDDIHPRVKRKYGSSIIELINQPVTQEAPIPPEPLTPDQRQAVKRIKQIVSTHSETLNLPPTLLAKKADIEAMVRDVESGNQEKTPMLSGWRREVIGERVLEQLG